MKRETLRHPKTYDLAARLGVSRATALGHLALLWDFTGTVAQGGDIGKWPNGAIAGACDWPGDPERFIQVLLDSGWLDTHPKHRLVIHHWPHHCERWVKKRLGSAGESFCDAYSKADQKRVYGPERPGADDGEVPNGLTPDVQPDATGADGVPKDTIIQTKPNQTNPIQSKKKPKENTTIDTSSSKEEVIWVFDVKPPKGKGVPKTWNLLPAHVEKLKSLYPGLNVSHECGAAYRWTQRGESGDNYKTARGMLKFLGTWMETAKKDHDKQKELQGEIGTF